MGNSLAAYNFFTVSADINYYGKLFLYLVASIGVSMGIVFMAKHHRNNFTLLALLLGILIYSVS